MNADLFVYVMMTLNAAAAVAYLYAGAPWKTVYWCAAFTLNLCVVNMK